MKFFLPLALFLLPAAYGEHFLELERPPPIFGLCLAQPRHPACGGVRPALLPSQELLPYFCSKHPWAISASLRLSLEIVLMCALACLLDSPLAAALLLSTLGAVWLARGWLPDSLRHCAAFRSLGQAGRDVNVLKEGFYMLYVALAAALLVWRSKNPTPGRSFLSALGVGASLLYRSVLFFLPPVLAVFDAILLKNVLPAKSRRTSILILALVPYLMLIPWIRMNWVVHHRFIPTEFDEADCHIVTGALGIVYSVEGQCEILAPRGVRDTGRILAWAAGEVMRHPLRYSAAYFRRLGYVFSLWPVLFSFSVLALWLYRKKREFQYLGVVIGYYVGVFCLLSIAFVYFIPLAPLLVSMAAAGASRMLRALSQKGMAMLGGLRGAPQLGRTDARRRRNGMAVQGGWSVKRVGDAVSIAAVLACLGVALLWSGYAAGKVEAYARVYPFLPQGKALTDEELDRAIQRHPGDAWLLGLRGTRELRGKRWRSAARDFSLTLAAQPGNPIWEASRAWALARLGRPEKLLRGRWSVRRCCMRQFLSAVEYWREGKRGLADRELDKLSDCIRRSCSEVGPHDAIQNLPDRDRWAKERLSAECRRAYFAGLANAPADFAIPRREVDAVRAEYGRVNQ